MSSRNLSVSPDTGGVETTTQGSFRGCWGVGVYQCSLWQEEDVEIILCDSPELMQDNILTACLLRGNSSSPSATLSWCCSGRVMTDRCLLGHLTALLPYVPWLVLLKQAGYAQLIQRDHYNVLELPSKKRPSSLAKPSRNKHVLHISIFWLRSSAALYANS